MPDRVDGQQHVLHRILDLACVMQTPRGKSADKRRDVFEKTTVGLSLARLSPRHQHRAVTIVIFSAGSGQIFPRGGGGAAQQKRSSPDG